jgi:hypothetical protein
MDTMLNKEAILAEYDKREQEMAATLLSLRWRVSRRTFKDVCAAYRRELAQINTRRKLLVGIMDE